jgi:DNA-directed RNA polymerase sigma subunit (sigma70/sigma32)
MTYDDVRAARAERVAAEDLSGLSYRERRCLELYYGLEGDFDPDQLERSAAELGIRLGPLPLTRACSLDHIGRVFNLTRERVRQIIKQAERKLRLSGQPEFEPFWRQ